MSRKFCPGDRVRKKDCEVTGTVDMTGWDRADGSQVYVTVQWDHSKGSVGACEVEWIDLGEEEKESAPMKSTRV